MAKQFKAVVRITVDAEDSVCPGLIQHRTICTDEESDAWNVTHPPSGLKVGRVWYGKAAGELFGLILSEARIDWSRSEEDLRADPEVKRRLKTATTRTLKRLRDS